jgi:hypothetical protein
MWELFKLILVILLAALTSTLLLTGVGTVLIRAYFREKTLFLSGLHGEADAAGPTVKDKKFRSSIVH